MNEISGRSGSGAQTLAATRTAGGENLAAAGGGETGAEAVTALAHQFAGLISPLHGSFSADRAICLINVMSPVMSAGPKRAISQPK
jgi:NADH dehydrogenase FAD-containing subunit